MTPDLAKLLERLDEYCSQSMTENGEWSPARSIDLQRAINTIRELQSTLTRTEAERDAAFNDGVEAIRAKVASKFGHYESAFKDAVDSKDEQRKDHIRIQIGMLDLALEWITSVARPTTQPNDVMREAQVEPVAKAICKAAYPNHNPDDYQMDERKLWQWFEPQARAALAAGGK